jgi:hypothetical protein
LLGNGFPCSCVVVASSTSLLGVVTSLWGALSINPTSFPLLLDPNYANAAFSPPLSQASFPYSQSFFSVVFSSLFPSLPTVASKVLLSPPFDLRKYTSSYIFSILQSFPSFDSLNPLLTILGCLSSLGTTLLMHYLQHGKSTVCNSTVGTITTADRGKVPTSPWDSDRSRASSGHRQMLSELFLCSL